MGRSWVDPRERLRWAGRADAAGARRPRARARSAARAICSRGCCLAGQRPRPMVSTGTRGSSLRLAQWPSGLVSPVGYRSSRPMRQGRSGSVRPGGVVLFGDGVWVREPLCSGLASFGMTRDELPDGPDGFAGLGVEAGRRGARRRGRRRGRVGRVRGLGTLARSSVRAAANMSDPEAEAFLARAQLFRSSYAEWRRDAFGFAVARFRVPA